MNEYLLKQGFSRYHLSYGIKNFGKNEILSKLLDFVRGYSLNPDILIENFIAKKRGYNLLVTSSSNGTGKTTILHILAIYFFNNRKKLGVNAPSFLFDQVSSFFKIAKDNMFSDTSENILEYMTKVDFLFIDDLDKAGKLTEFEMENLRLIIDKRYRDIKPIFMSSNLSMMELLKDGIIDSAMYSRLSETCTVVSLDGIDNRVPNSKPKLIHLKGRDD